MDARLLVAFGLLLALSIAGLGLMALVQTGPLLAARRRRYEP